MPPFAPDATLDSALDRIDQADTMHVLSAYTAGDSYATVVANSLASVAVTPDTDFTKADGATSGRRVTVASKGGVTATADGTALFIALVRAADSTVRYVTTCTEQDLSIGNILDIPSWAVEIRDPT